MICDNIVWNVFSFYFSFLCIASSHIKPSISRLLSRLFRLDEFLNQSAKSLYIQALPTYDTKSLNFCEKHIRNHMLYARCHIPAASSHHFHVIAIITFTLSHSIWAAIKLPLSSCSLSSTQISLHAPYACCSTSKTLCERSQTTHQM